MSTFGIGQLLIWAFIEVYQRSETNLCDRIKYAFKPSTHWGPLDPATLKRYQQSVNETDIAETLSVKSTGFWFKIYDNIFN